MREFIAPDLARQLQQSSRECGAVGVAETFLTEGQVRELLKYFNLDEIIAFTGPSGLPSARAVREMVDLLTVLDKSLSVADRLTLRPMLGKIAEGGAAATNTIDFLNRVARIHDVQGIKFNLAELRTAFENGDAILDHGPLQPEHFLEDDIGPYSIEGGKLQWSKEGRLPARLGRNPRVDFVIVETGGTQKLILGDGHSGLSSGRTSVFAVGRLSFDRNGFVVAIDRASGHYRASVDNLLRAVRFLTDRGILLEPVISKQLGRPEVVVDTAF